MSPKGAVFFLASGVGEREKVGCAVDGAGDGVGVLCCGSGVRRGGPVRYAVGRGWTLEKYLSWDHNCRRTGQLRYL